MSSSRPIVSLAKQQALRRELENCHLVAGIYCTGLSIRQLNELCGSLPETSSRLIVAKNSLMEKAVDGTKWEPLKFYAKGMNAWLFVHGDGDNVPRALKPCQDLQKKWGAGLNDFRGRSLRGRCTGRKIYGSSRRCRRGWKFSPICSGLSRRPQRLLSGSCRRRTPWAAPEAHPAAAAAEGAASA